MCCLTAVRRRISSSWCSQDLDVLGLTATEAQRHKLDHTVAGEVRQRPGLDREPREQSRRPPSNNSPRAGSETLLRTYITRGSAERGESSQDAIVRVRAPELARRHVV